MLDELNKIVPKLDDNDSNKMYNNLSKKRVGKKDNKINVRFMVSLAAAVMLIAVIIPLGIFISTLSSNQNSNNNNDNNNAVIHNYNFTAEELIGIAAYKVFDTNKNKNKPTFFISDYYINYSDITDNNNSKSDTNNTTNKISYSFDYIRIDSAYKFSINVSSISDEYANGIISDACGLGELEVVIAEFTTFVVIENNLEESISDTLICLRGYNGYYSILLNGYSSSGGQIKDYYFSSHKIIENGAITKAKKGPFLTIMVRSYGNTRYVHFERTTSTEPQNYSEDIAFKNTTEIVQASTSELYSVLNLTSFESIVSVEGVIIKIDLDNNIIKVTTDDKYNLEYIIINDTTEGNKITELQIGDNIIIEYEFLYDRYNPITVYATKISKK